MTVRIRPLGRPPSKEEEEPQNKKKLRNGFTTGTAATASSVAAILSILNQRQIDLVDVFLPKKNETKNKENKEKMPHRTNK